MRVFTIFLLLLLSNNIFSQKVNILKESKKLYKKGNFQEALSSIEAIEKNIVIINTKQSNNKNFLKAQVYLSMNNVLKAMEYYDKLKENDFSDFKLSKFSKEIAKIAMNIRDDNTHNKSFRIKPNQNLIHSLSGKVSGVSMLSKSGDPGSSPIIQIRGQNTVLGNNSPLVILDGVVISGRTEFSNNTSMQSRLDDIPIHDIESITIHKSAASSALWGSSGANGVIVIKTKQ
jgi:TonB-dependent SusC/RagA subfamily outer membrane receptor